MSRPPGIPADESLDTLYQGKLSILQSRAGYRFSLDALLLGHFVQIRARDKIADLGTGNGVIALLLATLRPTAQVVGIEIQEAMVTRAIRNAKLNRLHQRVEIVQGDVRSINDIFPAESFDVAVCNPPYRGLKSGRINPDWERRVARHEIKGSLQDFLRAGAYLLRPKGRMALIFPAARAVDLLQAMRTEGVEPKRLRLVHSAAGSAAALALVEGTKGGRRELDVMPPLVVYAPDGGYTTEAKVILGE